jgi:hypothetical protein
MARRQYSSPTPTTVRTTTDSREMNGHNTRPCCNMPARPTIMPTVSNDYTYIYTHSLRLFSFHLPPSFSLYAGRIRRIDFLQEYKGASVFTLAGSTVHAAQDGIGTSAGLKSPYGTLPLLLTRMQRHQLFKTYVFMYRQGERVVVVGC